MLMNLLDAQVALFGSAPYGVLFQVRDGSITWANDAAQLILGRTMRELQGLDSSSHEWDAIHEDGSAFPGDQHPSMVCLRTGATVSNVTMGLQHGATGERRWIRIHAVPVIGEAGGLPEAVYATFWDVTEERRQRLAGERWAALFNASGMSLGCGDVATNRVTDVNAAFARERGYEPHELIGQPLTILYPADEMAHMAGHIAEADNAGRSVAETVHIRKDGSRFPVLLELATMSDESGRPATRVAHAVDLTDRNEHAIRLRHLSDVAKATHQLHHVITDAGGAEDLLQRVCECLLTTRGYVAVWIGIPNEETGLVARAAYAPIERHSPDLGVIRWDDSQAGKGPTGTAIRERRPVVFNDVAHDPGFEPWRDASLAAGAASVCAVPMCMEDRVIGVLVVKADAVGAFRDEDVHFLLDYSALVANAIASQADSRRRRLAEEQLRASEERLRLLVQHMQAGVLVRTPRRQGIYANEQAGKILGLTHAQVMGLENPPAGWQMIDAEGGAYSAGVSPMKAVLRTRGPVSGVILGIRKPGLQDPTWVEVHAGPRLDADGNVDQVVITFIDVTERQNALRALREAHDGLERRVVERTAQLEREAAERFAAQEALRETDAQYRRLVDGMLDGFATSDLEENFLHANAAFCRMVGRTVDELKGLTFQAISDPAWLGGEERLIVEQVMRRGYSDVYEKQYIRTDGVMVPVELRTHLSVGRDGQPTGFCAIVRDCTARKEAERELLRSRAKYQELVESMPEIIFSTDAEGRLSYLSPAVFDVLGYRPEELLGRIAWDTIDPAYTEAAHDAIVRSAAGGDVSALVRTYARDGSERWLRARSKRAGSDGGRAGVSGILTDVTGLIHAEEALRAARDMAEAANKAKSTFLANLSHEIRTPLNAILGYAQLMGADADIPDRARANLEVISRSGRHLLSLINDVLVMSRIDAGRVVLDNRVFHLGAVVEDVAAMFRVRAQAKSLNFTVAGAETLPAWALGDEGKIRQVLVNLLGNAVKFTQRGGVTLRVAAETGDDDVFRLTATVEDTGPGIAVEELSVLFKEFEQAAAGRRMQTGTGLGLAISRDFAHLMGGEISVQSEIGKGSSFTLRTPLQPAEAPDRPVNLLGPVVGLAPGAAAPTILVADDVPANRHWLRDALAGIGLSAIEAADGQEAVDRWIETRCPIVLMDMRMPRMDGREAIARIRAEEGGGEVTILALTAAMFEDDRQALLQAGASDVLVKPIALNDLYERLERQAGVRFLRAGGGEDDAGPAGDDIVEALRTILPAELAAELRAAALAGDSARLADLVGSMGPEHAVDMAMLGTMVERYDYDGILRVLEA
ncbi:MAG: PAS domain S-box protein [Armatimonadetes bacterium]|nr:PAS domain S-box protein [Armatimonadota bacterium]